MEELAASNFGAASAEKDAASSQVKLEQTIKWEFPKIRGTFLGVSIKRTIVYWGLYWGTPNFGKLPSL